MKVSNHINVLFVISVLDGIGLYNNTLQIFMKIKRNTSVLFVMQSSILGLI